MRILCDQNVASKYVTAFEDAEWVAVTTVAEVLDPEASDGEIAEFATANEWVVFTTDDDFFAKSLPYGLVVYSQVEDPRPGDVRAALRAIADAYESHDEIVEYVPDGWA